MRKSIRHELLLLFTLLVALVSTVDDTLAWMSISQPVLSQAIGAGDTSDVFTVTFHFYEADLDPGEEYLVVPVTPDEAINPDLIPEMPHRLAGHHRERGYVFWGWFDDDTLDASGRVRAATGFRRPGLGDIAFDLDQILTEDMFDENQNIDLFAIWVLWGDVNDDDVINLLDLNLFQQFMADIPTVWVAVAANVIIDYDLDDNPNIDIMDFILMQEYMANIPTILGQIIP